MCWRSCETSMRIAFNRETKCRIQGSPYFWSRPPASPLLPFFEIFQTQNAWDLLCNQGGRQQPCFWGLLFWYDTNNALLIYVDFLLSNVQISVFNPSWILRYCAKLLFDQDAANARIQGELQGKLDFLSFNLSLIGLRSDHSFCPPPIVIYSLSRKA